MMQSVEERIFAQMSTLSPAEKKVARTLLADYPSAGLGSAAALAAAAGTSTPTVLRLLARLEIGSYPEFRARLRDEVSERLNSPVSRAERSVAESSAAPLESATSSRLQLVGSVTETVPPGEFDAAVNAIAGAKKTLLTGGYFSRYIVRIVAAQLDQLVPGVAVAEEPLGRDAGLYLGLGKDSVAVVIDMRRYEMTARKAIGLARAKGACTILITDEGLSPAAEDADIVLPVRVDAAPFDSFASLLVLAESLVDAVFHTVGGPALERMREWEHTVQISRALREEPDQERGGTSLPRPRGTR